MSGEVRKGFSVCVAGIPGVGKTRLLREHVARTRGDEHVTGSSVIKAVIAPATVEQLDRWSEEERLAVRGEAIDRLRAQRTSCHGRLLVDGHFTLRNRASGRLEVVFNEHDRAFYDALLLVEAPPADVVAWRLADTTRVRAAENPDTVALHMEAERLEAVRIAEEMGVPLCVIEDAGLEARLAALGAFLDAHAAVRA
jgi:adenylate kinase